MNKKILKEHEVQAFVEELYAERQWAIAIEPDGDDFAVKWIEHKSYVSYTGETHPDEIWRTEAGELMCIQDMSPEHARNALRMLLRSRRLMQDALLAQLENGFDMGDLDAELDSIAEDLNQEDVRDGLADSDSPYYHGKKPTLQ